MNKNEMIEKIKTTAPRIYTASKQCRYYSKEDLEKLLKMLEGKNPSKEVE